MTPYQKGHRDALLALAVEIEACVATEREKYTLGDNYVVGSARHQAVIASGWRIMAMQSDANLARRRAEALPHDPEENP